MGKFIALIMPKPAAINRLFGAVWMFLVGQVAILFALFATNDRPLPNFAYFWTATFLVAFLCSFFLWTRKNAASYALDLAEVIKAIIVILVVVSLSMATWFPTKHLKFDIFLAWLVLCWTLQIVGVVRFGLIGAVKLR